MSVKRCPCNDCNPPQKLCICAACVTGGQALDQLTGEPVEHKQSTQITETKIAGPCPDFTIKYRKDQPPYVEVRLGDQLMVAGWVCPTPEGPVKPEPERYLFQHGGPIAQGTLADRGITVPGGLGT